MRCNMLTGYYINKQKREQDPYYGMFNGKQLRDLEGETTMQVKYERVTKTELKKRVNKTKGAGQCFTDPVGWNARTGRL